MLAIHPPEYWPRLATLSVLASAETIVLADTFQYSRQSYQNRARIRNPQGWHWLSVPLKGGQHGTPIAEVRIRDHLYWRGQHRRGLHYSYRSAPFYIHYGPTLEGIYDHAWKRLGPLTVATTRWLCDALGISASIHLASELPGQPATVADICAAMNASALVMSPEQAPQDGPRVSHADVVSYEDRPYVQAFDGYEAGLAGLDALLNYGPEAVLLLRNGTRRVAYEAFMHS